MSFLSTLANARAALRPTSTHVTTMTGQVLIETSQGMQSNKLSTPSANTHDGCFLIVDNSPDGHLHEVIPRLFIGSQDAACNANAIKELHVTHVVNAATMVPNFFRSQKDAHEDIGYPIEYLNVEVTDLPTSQIGRHFERANAFIWGALHEGEGKGEGTEKGTETSSSSSSLTSNGVLIHCNAGISRSTTLLLAYLVGREGMALDDAFKKVKTARTQCNPNFGFWEQLKRYESEVAKEREAKAANGQ